MQHSYTTGGQVEKICMIVVVGVTGAGKSYFINSVAGKKVVDVGDDLAACKLQSTVQSTELTNIQAPKNVPRFRLQLAKQKFS